MADIKINNFPSGSISDTSLGVVGDPSTGTLFNTTFLSMKNYFTAGITGSGGTVNTGSLATTASLNALSSSYVIDSSSFNSRINNISFNSGSLLLTSSFNTFSSSYSVDSASFNSRINNVTFNSGSLVTTSSFYNYTASTSIQILNVFASESNYLPTSSFTVFSASYHSDSASFNAEIQAITGSGGGVNIVAFNNYTSSTATQSLNIFASQSNYTPTSSLIGFNTYTSSFNTFSGSYVVDSSSFNNKIVILTNLSSSYVVDSGSFNSRLNVHTLQIANIFASESNYVLTSSFVNIGTISGSGTTGYISLFNGSTNLSSSRLYQSGSGTGSAILVGGNTTGSNGSILQVFGNTFLSGALYDGSNSTGSLNYGLISSNGSILWAPTTSINAFSSSYVVDSASFNSRIAAITGSGGGSVDTGSLLLTSSFNTYTSSANTQIANVFASESNYTLLTAFNTSTGSLNTSITNTSSSLVTLSSSLSSGSVLIGGNAAGKTLTIGTRDNNPIIFLCNGTQVMEIFTDGHVAFGNGAGGDPTQLVYFPGTVRFDGVITVGAASGISVSSGFNFTSLAANNSPNNTGFYWGMNNNFNTANTNKDFFALAGTSQLSSGTGETITQFHIIPTINNTGGAGHIFKGVSFAPVTSSLTGSAVIAFENTIGDNNFNIFSGSTFFGQKVTGGVAAVQISGSLYVSGSIYDSTNVTGSSTGSYVLTSSPSGIQWTGAPINTLIGQVSASVSQSIAINTSYNRVEIHLSGWQPVTAGGVLLMQVSSDGVNFSTGSSDYEWGYRGVLDGSSADAGSATTSSIQLSGGTGVGNTSGRSADVFIRLSNPGGLFQPKVTYEGSDINGSGNFFSFNGGGVRVNSQVTKAVKFFFTSGNIATGTYRVVSYP